MICCAQVSDETGKFDMHTYNTYRLKHTVSSILSNSTSGCVGHYRKGEKKQAMTTYAILDYDTAYWECRLTVKM